MVVVPPPSFDEHLGFLQRVEDLSIQQLISEFAVETLVEAVLPRAPVRPTYAAPLAPRFGLTNEERLHIDPTEPFTNRFGGELRSVVGADVIGWATVCEHLGEQMENVVGPDTVGNQDCYALLGYSSMMLSIRKARP